MRKTTSSSYRPLRALMIAGVAAIALSACASNRTSISGPDFSGLSYQQKQAALADLTAKYKARPTDIGIAIAYASALRSAGQSGQAVSVLENLMVDHGNDPTVRVAFAKALAADGRFEQAMSVIDGTIRPEAPDWNALSVKGAILDQTGQNAAARAVYNQALLIAPDEPSLYANLGLSYAMTGDLASAEQHLRKAVKMRRAQSQVRQNLALVLGLQGRFDEARAIYSAELPPDQVEANMAYIRALLTQQNRWDVIKKGETG